MEFIRFLDKFKILLAPGGIAGRGVSLLIGLSLSSCAILHSTQISDVDSRAVKNGRKFEILLSETGVNVDEAATIVKALASTDQAKGAVEDVANIISLFQQGPRTGNPVFNEKYADAVVPLLKAECPSGRISSLLSVRETAKYPVVSGEIVKLIGYCVN